MASINSRDQDRALLAALGARLTGRDRTPGSPASSASSVPAKTWSTNPQPARSLPPSQENVKPNATAAYTSQMATPLKPSPPVQPPPSVTTRQPAPAPEGPSLRGNAEALREAREFLRSATHGGNKSRPGRDRMLSSQPSSSNGPVRRSAAPVPMMHSQAPSSSRSTPYAYTAQKLPGSSSPSAASTASARSTPYAHTAQSLAGLSTPQTASTTGAAALHGRPPVTAATASYPAVPAWPGFAPQPTSAKPSSNVASSSAAQMSAPKDSPTTSSVPAAQATAVKASSITNAGDAGPKASSTTATNTTAQGAASKPSSSPASSAPAPKSLFSRLTGFATQNGGSKLSSSTSAVGPLPPASSSPSKRTEQEEDQSVTETREAFHKLKLSNGENKMPSSTESAGEFRVPGAWQMKDITNTLHDRAKDATKSRTTGNDMKTKLMADIVKSEHNTASAKVTETEHTTPSIEASNSIQSTSPVKSSAAVLEESAAKRTRVEDRKILQLIAPSRKEAKLGSTAPVTTNGIAKTLKVDGPTPATKALLADKSLEVEKICAQFESENELLKQQVFNLQAENNAKMQELMAAHKQLGQTYQHTNGDRKVSEPAPATVNHEGFGMLGINRLDRKEIEQLVVSYELRNESLKEVLLAVQKKCGTQEEELTEANTKLESAYSKIVKLQEAIERHRFLGTHGDKEPFNIQVQLVADKTVTVQVCQAVKLSMLIRRVRAACDLSAEATQHPCVKVNGTAFGHMMTLGEAGVVDDTALVQFVFDV